MNPDTLVRLSEMGPVAHAVGMLAIFGVVLAIVRKRRKEAFWPALLAGMMGIMVGGSFMIAGTRVMGLKILSSRDIDRIVRESRSGPSRWRGGRQRVERSNRGRQIGEGRFQLAMLVRALDTLTQKDPKFLDDKQAQVIVSMIEVLMPKDYLDDDEAYEIVVNIGERLSAEQKAAVRQQPVPPNPGIWSVMGGVMDNPLQSESNADAVLALQKRYEHVKRVTISPKGLNLLDL
ncbi:MAG: hypothetical protein ACPGVU_19570 [Limisphaerales bacterium]